MNNSENNLEENKTAQLQEYIDDLKKSGNEQKPLDENQKPDYLLPQFKTVEEQAKSYKELQALQTRQAQELAKYKKAQEINEQQQTVQSQIDNYKKQAVMAEQQLKEVYLAEQENLRLALQKGKISRQEAGVFSKQLDNFIKGKLQNIATAFKNDCAKCNYGSDMVSPKVFFQDDIATKNYLEPICNFLENNYAKMSKKDLDSVKNLVVNLENALRTEILNETNLANENENYRKNLASATNLNPKGISEKIYTLAEIKNMKPEEFRKNQKLILEQFASGKIK